MSKWSPRVLVALALTGAALAGCGNNQKATASGAAARDRNEFTIALIAKSSTNPFFLAARTGAEAAAREISQQDDLQVRISWLTPPQEDGQLQAQRIEQAVNDGADAILISCSDASKVTGAINDAVDRGVPVMTFDSDAPQSRRFAYYGVDDVKAGRLVMEELARQMNGKGDVAILAGNQNAPNLQKREQGVREEAAKYPGIHIVDAFHFNETPQDAAAEVVRVNNAYPNVTGWAMIGGWALISPALLNDATLAHQKVVSVDGLPSMLAYVDKGIAPVLLAQPVYEWGYMGVKTIVDHVHFGKAVPDIIPMELVPVTKANIGDWARQLKSWGFQDVPQTYLDRK